MGSRTPDARPAAGTLCLQEQTDRFTMSITRRNWKPHAAKDGCEPISLCGFESYSPTGYLLLKIDELGDSEPILRNKGYLRETAGKAYPVGDCSTRRRLEWMARSLSESWATRWWEAGGAQEMVSGGG
jgi:hypothetical protein